jgi:hypothetical protein
MHIYKRDIPKYKKKLKSKNITKSNHKHDYSEVVLLKHTTKSGNTYYSSAVICSICGKIRKCDYQLRDIIKCKDSPNFHQLTDKELLLKYKGCRIIANREPY